MFDQFFTHPHMNRVYRAMEVSLEEEYVTCRHTIKSSPAPVEDTFLVPKETTSVFVSVYHGEELGFTLLWGLSDGLCSPLCLSGCLYSITLSVMNFDHLQKYVKIKIYLEGDSGFHKVKVLYA